MTTLRTEPKSKLGISLQMYRADRPDEWAMDDFTRLAEKMQARIVELEEAISGILDSPHTKLTKGALLEVSEVDIDTAIKALNK